MSCSWPSRSRCGCGTSATARSTTTRARTPTSRGSSSPQGDYEYNPLLHGPLRFYLTAAMYARVRRHGLHGAARARADGDADGAPPLSAASAARARRRVRDGAAPGVRADVPVLLALRPRGHLHRVDHARAAGGRVPLPGPPATPSPGADRRPAGAELRDQGVDVHHRVRRRHVLPRCARVAARPAAAAGARGRPRRLGLGRWPRSSASSPSCSRPSSPTRAASGTGSTPAWSTGSASTTSAAAASRGSSTASCCSASSGRRCCSARSAPWSRCAARRCCACS